MPGIAGLITRMPRRQAEHDLRRMVATLRHEDFYVSDSWSDESLGIYVGWSARKSSFGEAMPIENEQGDVSLVFSGEEFPESDTARRLKALGHRLSEEGPSYLVHLYEDDPAFPAGLNGQFHGLLADRTRGMAMLFNDRYGMHRLYYHESKDALYFAAEAKAILAVRPELRSVNAQSLAEFVSCGCTLENKTMFSGISLVPAAAAWTFRGGIIHSRRTYFRPRDWEAQSALDLNAYQAELRQVFTQRLPRYFAGPERVGVALTGGLDTRVIMAWQNAPAGSLPCYTFNGTLRESQDVQVARRVADVCGQPHEVISAGPEFLSRFADYAERCVYLTDGCADVSRAPDLYVSEQAREIAPAKIVGTYGSEILAHVPTFRPGAPAAGLFAPELLQEVRHAEARYAELRREHPVTFAAFRQSPWWHHGVLALEQTQLTVRSPYLDNEFVRTVFRAPAPTPARRDVRPDLVREGRPSLARIRTDRGVGGSGGRILGAASRSLLDFTFKAEHAWDYAMPQWLSRVDHWLAPLHLERLFLGRHKPFHFRVWYRAALAEYVRAMLLDPKTLARPYLEHTALEALVRSHLRGDRNYTTELHKLLTLELFHRLFVDSRRSPTGVPEPSR